MFRKGRFTNIAALEGTASVSFLLDTLAATPLFAVSTRKLRSAYAGKALQIQSGSTDFGFDGSGNLDTSGLSGAQTIRTWYDQVGVHNCQNTTSAQQPTIQTSDTQNGHVWASGQGGGIGLPMSLARASSYTVAVVARLDVSAANNSLIGTQFAGSHFYLSTTGGSAWSAQNTFNSINGGTANTSVHGIVTIMGTSSIQTLVDGASVLSGPTTFDSLTGFDLWDFAGSGAHIAEVIVFAGVLSSPDQTLLKSNWNSYWGTP